MVFCGAQEDCSALRLSDGALGGTLSGMWELFDTAAELEKSRPVALPRYRRGDALHTTLFDNRLRTHFNVAREWVGGAEWGPRGRRRRDLEWCDF